MTGSWAGRGDSSPRGGRAEAVPVAGRGDRRALRGRRRAPRPTLRRASAMPSDARALALMLAAPAATFAGMPRRGGDPRDPVAGGVDVFRLARARSRGRPPRAPRRARTRTRSRRGSSERGSRASPGCRCGSWPRASRSTACAGGGRGPVAPALEARLAAIASRMRVTRAVRLLESASVRVPGVVGALRPAVLLPVGNRQRPHGRTDGCAARPRARPRRAARLPRSPRAGARRDAPLLPPRGLVGLAPDPRRAGAGVRRPRRRRHGRRPALRPRPPRRRGEAPRPGRATRDGG